MLLFIEKKRIHQSFKSEEVQQLRTTWTIWWYQLWGHRKKQKKVRDNQKPKAQGKRQKGQGETPPEVEFLTAQVVQQQFAICATIIHNKF